MEMQETATQTNSPLVSVVNGSGQLRCTDSECTGHKIALDRAFVPALSVIAKKIGRPVEEGDLPAEAICRFAADDRRKKDQHVYLFTESLEQVRKIAAEVAAGNLFWCTAEGHLHPIAKHETVVPPYEEARKLLGKGEGEEVLPHELNRVAICVYYARRVYHKVGLVTPYFEEAYEALREEEEERTVLAARRERARQLAFEAEIAEAVRFAAAAHPVPKTPRWKKRKNRREQVEVGEE